MSNKIIPDWERIEADYRAGLLSLREIASPHGVTEGAVRKRAKRDGWERNLKAKIHEKVEIIEEKDKLDKSGFVYVIYILDSASEIFYKIGMASTFNQRFGSHQCSSPFKICVACAYYVGNMRYEEKYLHAKFADKRIRGEWFKLNSNDLAEIASRSLLI